MPQTFRFLVLAAACSGALALVGAGSGSATGAGPRLPPGQDPGGTALALIGGGLDYLAPGVVERVARDGEGELVGWDFVDQDQSPYVAAGYGGGSDATLDEAAAALLATYRYSRLVPIRVPPGDPGALARAIAFAAGSPARVIALALPMTEPTLREVVRQAASRFRDHLFVVASLPPRDASSSSPASVAGAPAPPAAGNAGATAAGQPRAPLTNIANILVVAAAADVAGASAAAIAREIDLIVVPRGSSMFGAAPGAPPRNSAEAVAMAAAAVACQEHGGTPLAGSAAKAATLQAARPIEGGSGLQAIDPLCFYGGKRL